MNLRAYVDVLVEEQRLQDALNMIEEALEIAGDEEPWTIRNVHILELAGQPKAAIELAHQVALRLETPVMRHAKPTAFHREDIPLPASFMTLAHHGSLINAATVFLPPTLHIPADDVPDSAAMQDAPSRTVGLA